MLRCFSAHQSYHEIQPKTEVKQATFMDKHFEHLPFQTSNITVTLGDFAALKIRRIRQSSLYDGKEEVLFSNKYFENMSYFPITKLDCQGSNFR